MSGCCTRRGYDTVFDERAARRDLRRYRRRGLPGDARRGVEFLRRRGIRSLLEVGGGIGAPGVELLRAGDAERAVTVELSAAYDASARELAAEAGVADRVERRHGDFVAEAAELEPADAVVLNRVVCCYPDHEALLAAAASRARRFLVLTYPRDDRVARAVSATINLVLRLSRTEFRTYVHRRRALLAVAAAHGFGTALDEAGLVWRTTALERTGAPAP